MAKWASTKNEIESKNEMENVISLIIYSLFYLI